MSNFIKYILKVSLIAVVLPGIVFAAQAPNQRGSNAARNATRSADTVSNAAIRRSATSVIARSANPGARQSRTTIVTARPATVRAASLRSRSATNTSTSVARSASKATNARSAVNVGGKISGNKKLSRAASARATAVFNDVSKIGGGYANCRDAYATCMDQLCANANDTYRRCFCSDRFTEFRDTADKLDEALKMLAEFQDNNLDAVGLTAAEVDAMYTATAGEEAIKRDTSASQKLLDSISDVLSGKKTKTAPKQNMSLGVLDLSGFASNNDDIFGGGSASGIFGGGDSYTDVSALEGKELYDTAMKQCSEITRESCGGDAMFNLARSAYSIMITQDCNAYEKNINAKKASVEETVRTAEKYLREARLDEYRAHNSASVNECLTKVEEEMRKPVACGENYEKCMDYTGKYINSTTGEPIYSQALFGLNNLIDMGSSADDLSNSFDILSKNPEFNKWLEGRKMFAETALDSCRDDADTVWYEFKRSVIIQIAQAQDAMIQKVKDSCVATIKQCYDKQTGDLKSMDTTELQGTGAIAAATARGMCYDRVMACAALYGDPDGCYYDDKTKKLTVNEQCTSPSKNGKCTCGLQSLLTFVDTVDSVKVAEGCESVLTKYVAEICPKSAAEYNKDGTIKKEEVKYGGICISGNKQQLRAMLENRMNVFCAQDMVNTDESNTLNSTSAFNTNIMNQLIKQIYDELGLAFSLGCEEQDDINNGDDEFKGQWVNAGDMPRPTPDRLYPYFYKKYYGITNITSAKQVADLNADDKGWCLKVSKSDTESVDIGKKCEITGGTWENKQCDLPNDWYVSTCTDVLGGVWTSAGCQVDI